MKQCIVSFIFANLLAISTAIPSMAQTAGDSSQIRNSDRSNYAAGESGYKLQLPGSSRTFGSLWPASSRENQ